MPEKTLWPRNVGMETLNSVGSTGSCDSMESISSNHSAFSGDGYDHLSAEERECLMFLENTIDSLDNENDSGLSNDELENNATPEPIRIPSPNSNDKTSPKITTLSKPDELANVPIESNNKIPQGYHSFPRVVQAPREEIAKHSNDSKLEDSSVDPKKRHGKHKSLSSINQQTTGESSLSQFLILPPPEPFRDPQVIDKRRSVTDPTDSREVRFDRAQLKSARILEHKETPTNTNTQLPSMFPRVILPSNMTTGSQQNLNQVVDKPVDFRQGPPTAPKPRTLPPHIIIKTSGGALTNLEPLKRSRAFSAHERSPDKVNESIKARHEALQKLGLENKPSSQENSSIRPSKSDISSEQGISDQGQKDANRKSTVLNLQERLDPMGAISVQPSTVLHKPQDNVRNEGLTKNRLSMKLDESVLISNDNNVIDKGYLHNPKSDIIVRNRHSVKPNLQKEAEVEHQPTPTSTEVDTTKHVNSDIIKSVSLIKPLPQSISDNVSDKSGHTSKEKCSGLDIPIKNQKHEIEIKPSSVKVKSAELGTAISDPNHLPVKTYDNFPKSDQPQEKVGSLENINIISTSPGKTFMFPRPKEVLVSHQSPEVVQREGRDKVPIDKNNRHSTHFEPLTEPYLRFPQGSVPGLRQISIKSNTLERSGVGLSSSVSNIEKEKGGNSFFKKQPLFSVNFLRNNRPRPASLGTGKDFANLEPSTVDADTKEKRSFFSRVSRPSGPVTSVKITPKGSTEEHHKEALKKLGILKE